MGRPDGRTLNTPPVTAAQVPKPAAKRLALTAIPSDVSQPQVSKTVPPGPSGAITTPPKTPQEPAPQQGDTKRKVEVVLTAAAIAAISRRAETSITQLAGPALVRMT